MDGDPSKPMKYTLYIYKLYCEKKTICERKDGGNGKMRNCKTLMVKN